MKFIIAIIAAVVAMAMAQDQASGPQADADATNVRIKKNYECSKKRRMRTF